MTRCLLPCLLLAACGSVSATPDAGALDAPPDAPPVTLTAASPAASAVSIDVLTPIALTFSGPLADPEVHVYERSSRREVPVDGTSWDASSNTLTVKLIRPLAFATEYRVEVAGYAPFRFRTYISQETSLLGYDTNGNINYAEQITLDPEGFAQTRVIEDADGNVTGREEFEYRADGELTREVVRDAANEVTRWYAFDLGDAGPTATRQYNSSGADGVWLTTDDTLAQTIETTYDDQDRYAVLLYKNSGGAITMRQMFSYSDGEVRSDLYSAPGNDATWGTSDDVLGSTGLTSRDAAGRDVVKRALNPSGVTISLNRYEYSSSTGLLSRYARYVSPGPDGIWDSTDDQPSLYYDTTYDAQHRRSDFRAHDVGSDGIAFTADDTLRIKYYYQSEL